MQFQIGTQNQRFWKKISHRWSQTPKFREKSLIYVPAIFEVTFVQSNGGFFTDLKKRELKTRSKILTVN